MLTAFTKDEIRRCLHPKTRILEEEHADTPEDRQHPASFPARALVMCKITLEKKKGEKKGRKKTQQQK